MINMATYHHHDAIPLKVGRNQCPFHATLSHSSPLVPKLRKLSSSNSPNAHTRYVFGIGRQEYVLGIGRQ